jgi:hypothetical protein
MKWVTVKEYAEKKGITLAAAYKQISENRVRSGRRYGKLVVAVEKQAA